MNDTKSVKRDLSRMRSGSVDARLSQESVAGVYDQVASFYDLWARLAESHARRKSIALAGIKDGDRVLEVAVGTGLAFHEIVLQNPTGTNVGMDISPGMLARARKRMKAVSGNHDLRLGSAFDVPFHDNSFDILINSYMFDLIPFDGMDRIVMEFRRVLKPGGRLVLTNMTHGQSAGSHIYDWIYKISPALFGGCRPVQMSEKLVSHDFVVESREHVEQKFFPSEIIVAHKN